MKKIKLKEKNRGPDRKAPRSKSSKPAPVVAMPVRRNDPGRRPAQLRVQGGEPEHNDHAGTHQVPQERALARSDDAVQPGLTKRTTLTPTDKVEIAYNPGDGAPLVDSSIRGVITITLMRKL